LIENIIQESKKNNCNLVLPEDVITSKDHNSKGTLKSLDQINDNDLILDIGEKTLENITKKYNFNADETIGMKFNLLSSKWSKSNDTSVNYISTFLKD